MKYYEVDFNLSPTSSDACDLLAAIAGEAGFETFEETDNGLKGYVQQQLFDREQLDLLLSSTTVDTCQNKPIHYPSRLTPTWLSALAPTRPPAWCALPYSASHLTGFSTAAAERAF